jgi:hypothetical protein
MCVICNHIRAICIHIWYIIICAWYVITYAPSVYTYDCILALCARHLYTYMLCNLHYILHIAYCMLHITYHTHCIHIYIGRRRLLAVYIKYVCNMYTYCIHIIYMMEEDTGSVYVISMQYVWYVYIICMQYVWYVYITCILLLQLLLRRILAVCARHLHTNMVCCWEYTWIRWSTLHICVS